MKQAYIDCQWLRHEKNLNVCANVGYGIQTRCFPVLRLRDRYYEVRSEKHLLHSCVYIHQVSLHLPGVILAEHFLHIHFFLDTQDVKILLDTK